MLQVEQRWTQAASTISIQKLKTVKNGTRR